jgi:hypothetical protein
MADGRVVSVRFNDAELKQLDDLRRGETPIPTRTDVLKRLVREAHGRLGKGAAKRS